MYIYEDIVCQVSSITKHWIRNPRGGYDGEKFKRFLATPERCYLGLIADVRTKEAYIVCGERENY
ncbi:hypothetical protein TSAR_011750 [Trichomalopsis sarcophagae]|uniref:Uncharacterized protein n=1 Tax=Trichomalopsis sarcophagae TaxID=543379 RepID=A0A232EP97_9HYME|nr:hypothetical protein TSAR_011750 [Trichomalopsis sarcophagae]